MSVPVYCLLVSLALTSVSGQFYNTRYDNVNLDQILNNDRLLNSYFNCLVDRGSCTADGQELKGVIPDALHSRCSKCSPRQRQGSEKVLRFLIQQKPQLYQQLERKYDPTGYYRQSYSAAAQNIRRTRSLA